MAESESKVFKPRLKHLLPVFLGLLATGILAYPISIVAPAQAQVTPFDVNSVTGASLNAVVFVFALGASATVMFLLVRRGRMRVIRRLVKGALVVYDIVAVFRGPVGALAKAVEAGDLPGAMYTYGELTIGMGDLVFYSLVATTAMVFFGLFSFFGAALGILAGSYLGFRALSRYEMFPGLPFSLLLGVAGMLLVAIATGTLVL